MTTPQGPEPTVADVTAELDVIAARLAAMTEQVAALRGALPPAPYGYAAAPGYPTVLQQFPAPPASPRPTLGERIAAASERGLVGRALAAAGVAITLIGIVLLLVLAAEAGLLGPQLRVAGGALLAAALYALGVRLGRDPGRRAGARALVATGVAAALLGVLAATAVYDWLPAVVGLILAAAVAAVGLLVAARWDSQPLAVTVGAGLLVLAPFVNGGVDALLVGFVLVYAAATVPLQLGRDWTALYAVNTAAATLPLLYAVDDDGATSAVLTALLAVNVAIALGSALLLLRTSTRPVLLALVSSLAALPLAHSDLTGDWLAVVLLGAVTALFFALTTGARLAGVTLAVRSTWLAAGAIGLLGVIAGIIDGDGRILAYLAVAVALSLVMGRAGELDATVRAIATGWTALSVAALLSLNPLGQLLDADALRGQGRGSLLIATALAVVAIAALAWGWVRVRGVAESLPVLIIAGLTGLGLLTVLCVTAGVLVTGGGDGGFRGGHLTATLVYAVAGGAGLLWARRLPAADRGALLLVGLAVVAGAVAKLFLFDLAALGGALRVTAFLVTGLILLGLGVVYARSLATDPVEDSPATR
ncbi:DUF2339 domain-containing protein [Rhodococcus sp. D2-41]|uniref:DUF2339 domain-containing protein n=1 Tax=Speluncibacter jeojiensis TaxID=2710754 RepID=A0A9X4LYD3_9ACTN|nr:DUF2339 domain-containing protein [Rhodococcus sp. D2-41]MDG3012090.1 DUF2339 domain-containing protein [Rhodococcus sp. D2-41]MDG3013615.1 DUF2339 domain-containing protein [Corynebacteriales bacterium D3-21]